MTAVQHMHRDPEVVLEAIRSNLGLLTDLATAGRELGAVIDTDLKELYERRCHQKAGVKSFAAYIVASVGMAPASIRCILDHVWRVHQLLTDENSRAPGARRPEFPKRFGSSSIPKRQRLASAPPEPDATTGWLVALDPEAVIDQASDEQLRALKRWGDAFALAGRARGFCPHHPNARSADGRLCINCGEQVLR